MATASRTLTRALRGSIFADTLRSTASGTRRGALRGFQQQSRRGYSSEPPRPSSNGVYIWGGVAAAALLGGGYYTVNKNKPTVQEQSTPFVPKKEDYQAVYDAIAQRLIDEDDYDDGSYGPVVLRLGWHASGTYDAATNTGGSNGATMRFAPERDHGANSGLAAARDFLEPIHAQFPWLTYSDLWTLAAACAVQEMGGPTVPWRPGRADRDVSACTPDGRLPDGARGADHLRGIFGRMGFDDREIVALSGAHALGRCHVERSGFDGPWTFSPITLTNDFYKLLVEESWEWRKWEGPRQYTDGTTKSLMMLPTDYALVQDPKFLPWVRKYAEDADLFFRDFSNVLVKLFELGVPFTTGEDARIEFRRTE